MKKVMCFGSFDIFHDGHKYFLNKSQEYGDFLYIVVARDLNIKKIKQKEPNNNEQKRISDIKKHFSNTNVILGDENDFFIPIRNIKPNIICLGYDQKCDIDLLKSEFPEIKIVRIGAYMPFKFKSSKLRNTTT